MYLHDITFNWPVLEAGFQKSHPHPPRGRSVARCSFNWKGKTFLSSTVELQELRSRATDNKPEIFLHHPPSWVDVRMKYARFMSYSPQHCSRNYFIRQAPGDLYWSIQQGFLPTSAHDLLNHFQLLQAGHKFEQMFMSYSIHVYSINSPL